MREPTTRTSRSAASSCSTRSRRPRSWSSSTSYPNLRGGRLGPGGAAQHGRPRPHVAAPAADPARAPAASATSAAPSAPPRARATRSPTPPSRTGSSRPRSTSASRSRSTRASSPASASAPAARVSSRILTVALAFLTPLSPSGFRRDGSRRDNSRRHLAPTLGVHDMAIDLGTANTLVYVGGRGIVVSEPSVVASDVDTGEVHAVGADAERMIGRTPATISATRPLRHGVIADFEVTEEMLRYFIRKVLDRRMAHPRLIVCAPVGRHRGREARRRGGLAGRRRAPRAPDRGADRGRDRGRARDRGAGRADGRRRRRRHQRDGGDLARRDRRLALGPRRRLRDGRGDHPLPARRPPAGDRLADRGDDQDRARLGRCRCIPRRPIEVRGRHLVTGLPTAVQLRSEEVRAAITAPLREILRAIRDTLEQTPPELASDIARDGILLAGGGTLVRGFPELVADETGMPVYSAESPLTCVAFGSGQALDHFDELSRASRHRAPSLTYDWRTGVAVPERRRVASPRRREQDQERVDRLAEARRLDVDEHDAERAAAPGPPRATSAPSRAPS